MRAVFPLSLWERAGVREDGDPFNRDGSDTPR
jgi:hypothetical protein